MAPAVDLDERLIYLQVKVAEARIKHEDLVERRDVCRRLKYHASADKLAERADRAFNDLQQASRVLASYISQRQRGLK